MLVINAGLLIDGTGAGPREQMRLYVDGGRLVDIQEASAAAVPDDAEVLDAGDYVIMPGMIDAHVHTMWDGDDTDPLADGRGALVSELPGTRTLTAYANAQRDLAAGFTTIRDMHSLDFVDIALRDAIDKGTVTGPRISACGYGLTSTGGHMDSTNGLRPDVTLGGFDNVVDTPGQARKATRFLIKMGVNHIKLNAGRGHRVRGRSLFFAPEMQPDVLETICQEAHCAGRPVAAHSTALVAREKCGPCRQALLRWSMPTS